MISSTICRRCAFRPGGTVLPWNRFQVRTITALYCRPAHARRHRRPARLHAVVRPRARGGARARRGATSSCTRRCSASPSCRPPDGYRRVRALLPAVVARCSGGRGHGCRSKAVEHLGVAASLARHPSRRRARAVARAAAGRRARAASRSPPVFTAHDLLPRRTAEKRAALAAAPRPLRPRRRAHRARAGGAAASSGSSRVVIAHPVYPSHGQARRRRADDPRARRHPSVQGARGRGRGRPPPRRRAPARRRRPGDAARRRSRTRRAPSGGSAT